MSQIQVNTITNATGTDSPSFPFGLPNPEYSLVVGVDYFYTTLDSAITAAVDGDSILVVSGEIITTGIVVNKKIRIKFSPNIFFTLSSPVTTAFTISSSEASIEGLNLNVDANVTNAFLVSGSDCHLQQVRLIGRASAVITNAYNLSGSRNYLEGSLRATVSSSITNPFADSGIDNDLFLRG